MQRQMAAAALSKALEDMTIERDAAIVAKEDLIAQLRVTKRRLKDAEEEQCKAEEDSATLREEVRALHKSQQGSNYGTSVFMHDQEDIASIKSELEETWQRLQQEQLKLSTEQQRNGVLKSKLKEAEIAKQEAESARQEAKIALAAIQNKKPEQDAATSSSITLPFTALPASALSDTGTSRDAWAASSIEKLKSEKRKHEMQLHELALMVERLEKGRKKLLSEIDAQSVEIERLFVENTNLSSSVEETTEMALQWERQVQQCLEDNRKLRLELNQLRVEQAARPSPEQILSSEKLWSTDDEGQADIGEETSLSALRRENSKLKVELAETKAQAEERSAQVAQLSANLTRAVLASNTLGRMACNELIPSNIVDMVHKLRMDASSTFCYRPVLSNIENRLLQLKQDVSISDISF